MSVTMCPSPFPPPHPPVGPTTKLLPMLSLVQGFQGDGGEGSKVGVRGGYVGGWGGAEAGKLSRGG